MFGYIDDPGVGLSCGTSMTTNEADNSRVPRKYSKQPVLTTIHGLIISQNDIIQ